MGVDRIAISLHAKAPAADPDGRRTGGVPGRRRQQQRHVSLHVRIAEHPGHEGAGHPHLLRHRHDATLATLDAIESRSNEARI